MYSSHFNAYLFDNIANLLFISLRERWSPDRHTQKFAKTFSSMILFMAVVHLKYFRTIPARETIIMSVNAGLGTSAPGEHQ